MILSAKTIAILESMAKINPMFDGKQGSEFRTEQGDTLLKQHGFRIKARATVDEVFPRDWCIHPLPDFLKLVKMYPNTELDFEERCIRIIQEGKIVTNYPYSIAYQKLNAYKGQSTPKEGEIKQPVIAMKLILTAAMIKHIMKVASALSLNVFEVKDGFIEMKNTAIGSSSPNQRITINTDGDLLQNVPFLFNISVLGLLDLDDYEISLTKDSGIFQNLGNSAITYQVGLLMPKKDNE